MKEVDVLLVSESKKAKKAMHLVLKEYSAT